MNEQEYVDYFENLAIQSKDINHTQGGKDTFFYIEDGDDLDAFDQALRTGVQSPCMLLVGDEGELDDSDSENHVQQAEGSFYILSKKTNNRSIRELRAECFPIAVRILAKMKQDAKRNRVVPGKTVHFRISRVPYGKVGPMNGSWYGYVMAFRFDCPFGFSVTSEFWRDI